MSDTEIIEKALKGAYSAEIGKLYSVLANAIITADDNQGQIDTAKERFRKGLQISGQAYKIAKEVANI